jgi:hypothetical protein
MLEDDLAKVFCMAISVAFEYRGLVDMFIDCIVVSILLSMYAIDLCHAYSKAAPENKHSGDPARYGDWGLALTPPAWTVSPPHGTTVSHALTVH